ncbi:MAG: hypothetical protein KF887_10100 [Paracoccaceae bacterium]|nr:MAG: hypothetical protein KF887_10100 [Paracoccaceae bacterium]
MVDDDERADLIQRIIDGALGPLAQWRRPVSHPSVGPAFPEVFDRFEQDISQMRTALENRLALWSMAELGDIQIESEAPGLNPLFDKGGRLSRLAADLQRLKNHVPADFLGGWSVGGKEIDLPYWTAFQSVALDEAVFLSLGREPRKANIDAFWARYGQSDEEDTMLYFLEDRRELIANAMGCDPESGKGRVVLKSFLDWVEETRLPIDTGFHQALRTRFLPEGGSSGAEAMPPAPVGNPDNRMIESRERNSLAKLITAMAIDGYNFDPKTPRSHVPKKLEGIAALLGLEITADTIRKYLRLGAQYLPDGWNRKGD